MKQKILVVHNYYQIPGGEDIVVENEKKLLEANGHTVLLYSRNNNELKNFSVLKKLFFPFATIFNIKTYRDIKKIIRENDIDIVHVHNTMSLISPSVYYAAFACGRPVVQTMHNFRLLCPGAAFYRDGHICEECVGYGLKRALKYRCYRNSRIQTLGCVVQLSVHRMLGTYKKLNYICLTEFNKQKLLQFGQINEQRIFIKPNFTFSTDNENRGSSHYLFVGRIEEIKGLSVIIKAFEQLTEENILIVGTGSKLSYYQDYVKEKKLYNIRFMGYLNQDVLHSVMKKSKALIAASQWYETFGMVIIEAFSYHLPVITGNIGNMADLVDDGINGFKFQHDSPESLICAIKKYEASDKQMLREAAYEKFQRCFRNDGNYEYLKSIYDSVGREK